MAVALKQPVDHGGIKQQNTVRQRAATQRERLRLTRQRVDPNIVLMGVDLVPNLTQDGRDALGVRLQEEDGVLHWHGVPFRDPVNPDEAPRVVDVVAKQVQSGLGLRHG